MKNNNKYIEKVMNELDIYRRYLLDADSVTFTPTQADSFKKISIIRGYLLEGYSDKTILDLGKTDPQLGLQERRMRELLNITYDLFADTRLAKEPKGDKYLYSEIYKKAAQEVWQDYQDARSQGLYKEAAALIKEWRALRAEAGKIDKIYEPDIVNNNQNKRPHKVTFVKKVVNNNYSATSNPPKTIDITPEDE